MGPRYDAVLSSDERSSLDNGIWLCQNCGKLVDNDPRRFAPDLLREWKRLSEEAARLDIESPSSSPNSSGVGSDADLIRFFATCFDRPAFQDGFQREESMRAFDRAIEDTITALNTGCLRARDGEVLTHAKGKSYLHNPDWRRQMDVIGDLLRAIRSRYKDAVARGVIDENNVYRHERDIELSHWMDQTRNQILDVFEEVCRAAGIVAPFSSRRPRHW